MPGVNEPYDCIIVGGGPAGLAAAIYLSRFNRRALVFDHGRGRSTTPEINENYLGFPDGIASLELRERGREQALRFGAAFIEAKVEDLRADEGGFVAVTDAAEVRGRTAILATGVEDWLPEFDNEPARAYFGISLFWCITCDGHKVRDRRVAVVGADDEAATTALQFLNFTPFVSLITNRAAGDDGISDRKRGDLRAHGVALHEGEVGRLEGDDGRMRAVDAGDVRVELDFMFSMQGARPNSLLGQRLGVITDGDGYITVDIEQRTNIPRLYASGDVTKEYAHQIVTAAHEGATAAMTANYDLYEPWQRS
jgi:thioredoxin reductase (NADPH)